MYCKIRLAEGAGSNYNTTHMQGLITACDIYIAARFILLGLHT